MIDTVPLISIDDLSTGTEYPVKIHNFCSYVESVSAKKGWGYYLYLSLFVCNKTQEPLHSVVLQGQELDSKGMVVPYKYVLDHYAAKDAITKFSIRLGKLSLMKYDRVVIGQMQLSAIGSISKTNYWYARQYEETGTKVVRLEGWDASDYHISSQITILA